MLGALEIFARAIQYENGQEKASSCLHEFNEYSAPTRGIEI